MDSQGFYEKTLAGILREAGNIPVISLCGTRDRSDALQRNKNLTFIEIGEGLSIEENLREPEMYLRTAVRTAIRNLP